MPVQKEVLKTAVYYLNRDGHINTDLKDELDLYIDSLSDKNYKEVEYSNFNQSGSVDWVFDDNARTATNSTGGDLILKTSAIDLSNVRIKGFSIKAVDKDITVRVSKDEGVTFYNVDDYSCDELIESTDTLVIAIVSGDNVIERFRILYEQLY